MRRKNRDTEARRLILIRVMLELYGLAQSRRVAHEEAMVAMAVRRGQYQGRPMDVSDIAAITSIPISSVSRHLRALRRKGRVRSVKAGRRIFQHLALTAEPGDVARFYADVERIILRAAADISKMATSTVDKD